MTTRRPRPRRALTLTDLVIALTLAALALAMAARVTRQTTEVSDRIKCMENLKAIYKGLYHYSTNDTWGNFPRTLYTSGAPPVAYTGAAAPDPFAAGGPAANDVTAALFLLVRDGGVAPETFICPATAYTPLTPGPGGFAKQSNFPGNQNLAYSLHNPYADQKAVDLLGCKWNNSLRSDFAIAADMNPGDDVLPTLAKDSPYEAVKKGNSKNHGGQGQNVLYGDSHIVFEQTPFVSETGFPKHDCFYTVADSAESANGQTISGSPTHPADSVLLPVATVDPGFVSLTHTIGMYAGGAALVVAVLGLILFAVLRKRNPAPPVYEGQPYPAPPPPPPPHQ